MKPGLGSFPGLPRALDTSELKDFMSVNDTDAFSGLGSVLTAVGHFEEFIGRRERKTEYTTSDYLSQEELQSRISNALG